MFVPRVNKSPQTVATNYKWSMPSGVVVTVAPMPVVVTVVTVTIAVVAMVAVVITVAVADIATKSLRKAKSTIAANGAEHVFAMVQGKLKGNEIIECGLVAQVKAPKPVTASAA
jgi:hypothetical protein